MRSSASNASFEKTLSRGFERSLSRRKEIETCEPQTWRENRDSTATQVVERFKETGHPVFKSSSALSRGILKRKNDRDTIQFNADASNTELSSRSKSFQHLRGGLKLV